MIKHFLFRHPIGWVFWLFAYFFFVSFVGMEVLPDKWIDEWYGLPLVVFMFLSISVLTVFVGEKSIDYFS